MNITHPYFKILCMLLLGLPSYGNPANGSAYPQTVSALWNAYHPAIVDQSTLNTVSYGTTTIPNFFNTPGVTDVDIDIIRFDLGDLIGTNPDGSPKVKSPKIAALYARPSGQTNLPAIVNIHGGGQYPTAGDTSLWAQRGYAVISINWGGKNMDELRSFLPGYPAVPIVDGLSLGVAGANYDNTDWDGLAAGFARDPSVEFTRPSVTDPVIDAVHAPSEELDNETYSDGATLFEHAPHPMNAAFILNSYAARRAITFLESRPEVDASKIGALGFSMGGITTTVTGTDPRLKCIAPGVGGTGWDYEHYYGLDFANKSLYSWQLPSAVPPLPGTSTYAQYLIDAANFEWYQCTVSQESYWPEIQVPSLFMNATNDFNAPFDAVQRSIDLLPAGVKGVMVNSQHANHIPNLSDSVSQILWMEQYLKGNFSFPNEPTSSLDLTHSSGVPVFSVTPDASAGQTILDVEIFYGDEYYSLERFWHKGIAVETSPGTWQAALPAFDTSKPFIAFGKVTYATGVDVYTSLNATHDEFTITSEVQYANAEDNGVNELTANGIIPDTSHDRDVTSADDALEDWHDYQTFGGNFDYGTFKLGAPHYEGPDGGSALQLQISSDVAGNVIAVTVGESWGTNSFETYRTYKTLSAGVNNLVFSKSDFTRLDNAALTLPNWSDITLLKVQSARLVDPLTYTSNWSGDKPSIPLVSWIGGAYSPVANEAPAFSSDIYVKSTATNGAAYSATVSGDATEPATDPSPSAISYSKIAGPTWLTVAANGTLGGTPTSGDIGTNKFIVMAKDAAGGTDFTEVDVSVNASGGIPIKVLLLGGQSNSVGQSSVTSLTGSQAVYQNAQSDILFYYRNQVATPALTTLQPGSGGNTVGTADAFGPELSFGREIADAMCHDDIAIIKHGENGTSLAFNWFPDNGSGGYSIGGSYAAFQTTVADGIAALQAAGYDPEIVGMFWMQGETDAFNASSTASYGARLTNFISNVRATYGAGVTFVAGEITRQYSLGGTNYDANFSSVADQTISVTGADANAGFAQGADLVFFDNIHFDAPSTVTLGERMAAAYTEIKCPSTVTSNVTTTSSTTELAYLGDVSNTDLLHGLTPVVSATGWNATGPTASINDGVHGLSFGPAGNTVQGAWATNGASVEFNLDTSVNTTGYDIDSIQSFAAWSGGGFSNQDFIVEVRAVGGSWVVLESANIEPFGDGSPAGATKVTIADPTSAPLATGVEAIRFTANTVAGTTNGGAFIWREVDVFGSPSASKSLIYSEDFESSSPGTIAVGTSAFEFGWGSGANSFVPAPFTAITLDVAVTNGTYSNALNNLPASNFTGGRYYGAMGRGHSAVANTGQTFTDGTVYDFSFLQYQPKNTPFGGRAVTAEIYDVNTSLVYASQTFTAVNDQNVAQTRTLSYTATAVSDGNTIGLRVVSDSVDFDDASTTVDENNFYGLAIDNIALCASGASGNLYADWIQGHGVSASVQAFTADADGDGVPNGIEALLGTDPSVATAGLCPTFMNSQGTSFTHPSNASLPTDVMAFYQWTPDMVNWYLANGVDGPSSGETVTAVPTTNAGITTVVTSASSTQSKLFFRLGALN